jgi:thioesterase domain-containing protein
MSAADLLDYGAEMPPHRQRVIAAHHLAAENYTPRPYPGRITLFQARSQPFFTPVDPLTGWRLLGQSNLDFEIVAGSHEGMFQSPNVEQLAQKLRARLAQAPPNRAERE